MREHSHAPRWALNGWDIPSSARQRPKAAPAEMLLKEVPAGRSWFYSIRVGQGCTIVEVRVAADILGTDIHLSTADHTHHHQGLSHAEATRLKRKLCEEGLFYAGGPL